jgi:chemotaxis protein MotA
MDLSTLIGTLLCFGFVWWSMALGGDMSLFWDTPSVVLVGGGTLAVVLMNFTIGDLGALVKVMVRSFLIKLPTPDEQIEKIIEYANLARREGLLGLEAKVAEIKDPFFAKGVQCLVDGFSPETVRGILELDTNVMRQRHAHGKKLLETFATFAPAFGMIGTLIGLVQMLANMSDPSQIGAGMAVALLTTFYGAAMANMVFLPLAGKLDLRAKQEAQIRSLVIDGVLAIQVGEKPQIIRERLVSFLKPSQRQKAA